MPRIYIAGPMTGLPESNYPAFHEAAAAWRAVGWEVENPAEHFGGAQDRTYVEYVEADIVDLQLCDAIAMLPGWDSATARGSVWERAIARHLLKIPVYDAAQPAPPWALDDDPRAGEVIPVDYDEYQAFRAWRRTQQKTPAAMMPPAVQEFLFAAIPEPEGVLPLRRHAVTGALGRWSNG